MQLTMESLVDQLELFHPQSETKENRLISIVSVCFFTKKTQYYSSEILYIGYASDLSPNFYFKNPVVMICIEDVPLSAYDAKQSTVLRLSAAVDINAVYDTVLKLLKEDAEERAFFETLYQAVLRDDTINAICNLAKSYLENPIVVMDNSLKHIAESSDTDMEDVIWIDQRQNGSFISADYVQLLSEQTGYKKDHYRTTPVLLSKGKLKYRRIVSHIFLNHRPIGTIVIFEAKRNFRTLDLKFAKKLAEILAMYMRNNESFLYSRGVVYEHLFQGLLDGSISPAVLHEQVRSQHLQIGDDIYVMVIDISNFDRTYKTLQYFRSALDEILENGNSILYNNYVVIVVMLKSGICLSDREIEKVNRLCEIKKLSAGISRCFHDICMLKSHFDQAVMALRFNWKQNRTYQLSTYADYTPEHMIAIASESTDLKQFCEEGLLNLLEYDASNHTNFTDCLYVFLIHERNIAHTASALHMHRNTLIYRVNRIQEILKHDLDDSNYRFRLLFSFRILKQLHHETEQNY